MEPVLQLHREFLRAGADVMQAFTFYASDDKLENRGNTAKQRFTGAAINKAAADHAKKVAAEGDALTLGGICQCPSYLSGAGKDKVTTSISIFIYYIILNIFINYQGPGRVQEAVPGLRRARAGLSPLRGACAAVFLSQLFLFLMDALYHDNLYN